MLRAHYNIDHENQTQREKMPLEGQMVIESMFLGEKSWHQSISFNHMARDFRTFESPGVCVIKLITAVIYGFSVIS